MNNIRKKGISLIILIVTIVMMIILASTIIIQMNVSQDNARLSVFVNNITQIEENIRAKYTLENSIPTENTTSTLSKNDVLNIVSAKNKTLFESELAQNGESDSSVYYVIDVDSLGVDKVDTGVKRLGEDDVYVVSSSTLKVYYLYGVKYKDTRYFSTNENNGSIVDGVKDDSSNTTVTTYEGIEIEKNNSTYTNDMGIKIKAKINSNERLEMGFNGIANKSLNLSTGNVTVEFKSLEDLNSKGILSSNFSTSEISTFNALKGDNRKLYIYKYDNTSLIGTYEIDVSNFDNGLPSIGTTNVDKKDTFALIEGTVSDNANTICVSGIEQVRYEYVTRINGNSYYDNVSINEDYMRNKAKKVTLDGDGNFGLKIPLDVAILEIAAIDKAGNYISKTFQASDVVENKDAIPPVVVATGENELPARNKDIKITATDDGGSGLAAGNAYEYQLSQSNTTIPTSTWNKYVNNEMFNIGSGMTGTYYLWVRDVRDNAGNVSVKEGIKSSSCHVFGKYEFDNSGPEVQTIKVISPAPGNYPENTKVVIEVTFNENVYSNASRGAVTATNAPLLSIKFGSGSQIVTNFVSTAGNVITYDYTIQKGDNGEISIVSYTGNLYDRLGNMSSVKTLPNTGNVVFADTESPVINITPNGGNFVVPTNGTAATLKPVVNVTDNISGVNNSSLQYVWSTSTSMPTTGFKTFTNNTEVTTNEATAGIWYLYLKATDNVGNSQSVKSQAFFVVTDSDLAGRITLTPDKTYWTNTDVRVTALYGSNLTKDKTLTCNGTPNTDFSVNGTSYVDVKTNSKTVTATAKDGFGNMVTKTLQIQNIDKEKPTITASPASDSNGTEYKTITLTVGDTGGSGLLSTNTYQYQWSSSSTVAPTGTWSQYVSGRSTSHTGLNGNSYLWVKEIHDVATNASNSYGNKVSTYHVFGPYNFSIRLTVLFDSNGGNTPVPTSKSILKGSPYGTLATVTAYGRNFDGWYTAASGGTKVESTTTVTSDVNHTLYAHWIPWKHTVTFDASGGTGAPSSQTKTYGTDLTLPTQTPTKDGYQFYSWNTKADGTGESYAAGGKYTFDQDGGTVTLYAMYRDPYPPTCNLSITALGCQSLNVRAEVADVGSGLQKVEWYIAVNDPGRTPTYTGPTIDTIGDATNTKSSDTLDRQFTGLNDNTTYIIKVIVYDRSGNSTTKTITGTTIEAVCQNAAGVKYALIQTGFDSNNNTTITMLKNHSESASVKSGKTLTYNLNGKTVTGVGTGSSKSYTIENNGTLTITGAGTIVSSSNEWTDAVVNTAGNLTINMTGTVRAVCKKGNAVYNTSGNTTIKNGTFEVTDGGDTSPSSGTSIVKQAATDQSSVVEISGGKFILTIPNSNCVYNASTKSAMVRITNGTFQYTGTASSIVICNGNTTDGAIGTPVTEISGGTFTSSTGPSCTVLAQLGTLTAKGGTFSNTGTGVCMIVRRSATLNIQNSATSVTSQSENGTVHKDEGSTLNILDNPRITNTKYPDRTVMP